MTDKLTYRERELARRALGLYGTRMRSIRNCFITHRLSEEAQILMGLVNRGLAEIEELSSRYRRFSLTRAGAELALEPGETLRTEDFPVRISATTAKKETAMWNDIETAPKDRQILIYKPGWRYAVVAEWSERDGDEGSFWGWEFADALLCIGVDNGFLGWDEDIDDGNMPTLWAEIPSDREEARGK